MINKSVFLLEARTLSTDVVQKSLIVIFVLLCLYAVFQGMSVRSGVLEAANTFNIRETERSKAWRSRLQAVEEGRVPEADDRWAGLAMDVTFPAVRHAPALSDLATGTSDVRPNAARVSQWRSVERQFGMYQFQSPVLVAAGKFDLAFVILFVTPLFMIFLSYDAYSDDKDQGRLGLIQSQNISLTTIVQSRLVFRLGFLALALLLSLGIAFIWGQGVSGGNRNQFLMVFAGISSLYFLFWAAVIFWAISLRRKSETTILLLLALWIANTIVGPALLSSAAEQLYETPSRLEALSKARLAANKAYQGQADVMRGMLLDHPDLTVDSYSMPEYIRTNYLVSRSVDEVLAPLMDHFNSVQAQRHQFIEKVQYLSPVALTLNALNISAGTDLKNQMRYEKEVRDYKMKLSQSLSEPVLAGERLTIDFYDRLPGFRSAKTHVKSVVLKLVLPLTYLSLLIAILYGLGLRNFRRRLLEAR